VGEININASMCVDALGPWYTKKRSTIKNALLHHRHHTTDTTPQNVWETKTSYRNRQVEMKAKEKKRKKRTVSFFLFCLQKGKKKEQADMPMTMG